MVLVTLNRKGSLWLYPWRDVFQTSKKQLEDDANQIKTVYVTFEEETFEELLQPEDAVALFEAIGNRLPPLESVVIKLDVSPTLLPMLQVTPLIPALTSLLVGGDNNNFNDHRLLYLTLIGLQLLGDESDTNSSIHT
jgi:hypothetical protein